MPLIEPKPTKRTLALHTIYAAVALVTTMSLLHAVAGAMATFSDLLQRREAVQLPFGVRNSAPVVASVLTEARTAGLRSGDIVLQVDGRPFRGYIDLVEQARTHKPGDFFNIEVQRSQGTETALLSLRVPATSYGIRLVWAYTLQLFFFIVPVLSMLTGLYVLIARPTNPHAWLVFFILSYTDAVFFTQIFMPRSLIPIGIVWNVVVQTLLPISMLLFGLSFPDRSPVDRKYPLLKWFVILPQIVFFPIDLLSSFAFMYRFRLMPFPGLEQPIEVVEQVAGTLSIFAYFALLFYRMHTTQGDARRRLRILYWGAAVALTPLLILIVIATARGKQFGEDVPRTAFLISISLLLVLPLSMAYVVVVRRAMDLKMMFRQGTKYFFAKQSLTLIRMILMAWMAWEVLRLAQHPNQRRAVDFAVVSSAVALFVAYRLRFSGRLQSEIDRRFFRDSYSADQILSELSDEARTFTEVQPLLSTVTQRIGDALHIDRIAVFLQSGEHYQLQFSTGGMPLVLTDSLLTLPATCATINTLNRERRPSLLYRSDSESWLLDATDSERMALNELSAELLVPLPGRNRLLGVMTLGPKRSEEPYSRTDRQMLQSVASQTGLALENAELLHHLTAEVAQRERISREIEIAREVQQRLFPQGYPEMQGIDFAGHCRPAQAVGGDYYDAFVVDALNGTGGNRRLGVAIGDISGKGISASLLMASLRASLRSLARMSTGSGERDLTRLMQQLNQLVFESSTANRYATFFFAELDPITRMLTYVNAGHNPPVVLRGQQAIPLAPTGLVVGLLEDACFEQSTFQMERGDVLLAYTDGISEAMNSAEEEWGEEQVFAAAAKLVCDSGVPWTSESLVCSLFRDADAFTAGAPQHDDMTVVVCTLR